MGACFTTGYLGKPFINLLYTCAVQKALDAFDTTVVSLIYYVMFTSFTILASVIMYKNWQGQAATSIISEICGFLIILSGMTLLLATKILEDSEFFGISLYSAFSSSLSTQLIGGGADLRYGEFLVK